MSEPRRFELIEDLPNTRKGEIFTIWEKLWYRSLELDPYGEYTFYKRECVEGNPSWFREILPPQPSKDWIIEKTCPIEGTIFSVLRLSDGEVFSIGDDVEHKSHSECLRIDRIEVDSFDGELRLYGGNIGFLISNVSKLMLSKAQPHFQWTDKLVQEFVQTILKRTGEIYFPQFLTQFKEEKSK